MLDLKGVEYELADVLPGMQQVHMRLARFRGGTVPALVLDGRRVQGSRQIARALEAARPSPPLLPADPEARARVEAAERWGDEELQMWPRRMIRWGLVRDQALRVWLARQSRLPAPAVGARLSAPVAHWYAHLAGADETAVRAAIAGLPAMLDRVDGLLADGVLATDPPNAATLQVLCSVRALGAFADLRDRVAAHACDAPARALFPDYPEPVPPFLPPAWLAA